MTAESTAALEARVEMLERDGELMAKTLAETMAKTGEQISKTQFLLLVLEDALKKRGTLTDEQIAASRRAVSEHLTLELEYADTPEGALFRDVRRFIKDQITPPPAEPGPPTPPPAPPPAAAGTAP